MINKIIISTVLLITGLYGNSPDIAASAINTDQAVIKEEFVNAGDAKLFCRVTGKGQPLIVIHGGPGLTQDYLLPGMYELAKNNLVIFYDQRGCGRSTGEINTDTITIKSFVDDIEAIRRAFGFERISLLGHSWGSFLAMNYALAYPEHVERLVLSNSCPATSKDYALFEKEFIRRMAPYQEEINKITGSQEYLEGNSKTMEDFYRLIFRQCCYIPAKADLLNLWLTPKAALNGDKVHKCMNENVLERPFDLTCDLKKLKMNTLVIHGDADHVPPITAKHIHESIPASKYILMKNCGHFPYVEDPATYFKHVQEFLNPPQANIPG